MHTHRLFIATKLKIIAKLAIKFAKLLIFTLFIISPPTLIAKTINLLYYFLKLVYHRKHITNLSCNFYDVICNFSGKSHITILIIKQLSFVSIITDPWYCLATFRTDSKPIP